MPSVRSTHTADLSWLKATTDYSVFLRTTYSVIRIHPAGDEVVQTTVPELSSDGPLSFVPVAGGVLIRPLDFVPGYLVPDSTTARELPSTGGLFLPGPDDHHVWVESEGGMDLVDVTDNGPGGRVDARIQSVASLGTAQQLIGDGHGFMLGVAFNGNATYRVRPDGVTKLPIQRTFAVGPTRILGVPAKCTAACPVTELGPDFKKTPHQPDWTIDALGYPIGAVTPDGRTAAVVDRPGMVRLIDLGSGKPTPTRLWAWAPGQFVFSPDGRWLFGTADDARPYAIDVRTGRAHLLLSGTAGVRQLGVRLG